MNCSTPSGSDGHWDLDTERTANRSTGPPFIQLTKGNALDDFMGPAPPMEILDNQASTPGTKKSGRVNALPLTAYPSQGSCLFNSI